LIRDEDEKSKGIRRNGEKGEMEKENIDTTLMSSPFLQIPPFPSSKLCFDECGA
jgi:hypothetical protein